MSESGQVKGMVSIIVPAYNEGEAIGATLDDLQSMIGQSSRTFEIIVVDDGSADNTGEAANRPGVRVIRHRRNKGYGAALKTGTQNAMGDIIVFYDADRQFEPEDIERLLDSLGDLAAVFGNRTAKSHTPFSRKGGKRMLGWLANYLARQKIPDLNCGLRAIKREVLLQYLHLLPNGFSASTTTTLVFLKEGHDVEFVPITVKKRIGTSTVRPIQDGIDTVLLVMKLTVLLDPFRVFGPTSAVMFIVGAAWAVRHAMTEGRFIAPLFLMISAVMVFFFGLLADQVSSLRRERPYSDTRH